jgi:hypothetical protein
VDVIDREQLIAWLLDKARDEDETAEHRKRGSGPFDDVVLTHRDRATLIRSLVIGIEAKEPDHFVPPDLTTDKRKSGEYKL